MNETNNNTNMESEENLNDGLYGNNPVNGDSGMDTSGLVDGNEEQAVPDSGSDSIFPRTDGGNGGAEGNEPQASPDTENAAVSDGNGSHMESAPPVINDVSGGNTDAYLPPVSAGDVYNEYYNDFYLSCSCGDGMASPFTEDDVLHINGTLDALLFTTSGILFFIIFAWAEKKLSNAIKKLFRSSKPNL